MLPLDNPTATVMVNPGIGKEKKVETSGKRDGFRLLTRATDSTNDATMYDKKLQGVLGTSN